MLGRRASRLAPPRHRRGARLGIVQNSHGHGTMRRDRDIAPYRHYPREIRTRITHAHYARPRGDAARCLAATARGGSPPSPARAAAPRRSARLSIPHFSHAHCPCPVTVRTARAASWCAPLVPSCGRARCPHRAAAPSARCEAWHPVHYVMVPRLCRRWG